jgi:hypothetical protein
MKLRELSTAVDKALDIGSNISSGLGLGGIAASAVPKLRTAAAKIIPGANVAYQTIDAAKRAKADDVVGSTIAGASAVPILAIPGTAVQALRDKVRTGNYFPSDEEIQAAVAKDKKAGGYWKARGSDFDPTYMPEAEQNDSVATNARTRRLLNQIRGQFPQAQNDIEALLLYIDSTNQVDRIDINRLDQENDQEEADIARIDNEVDTIQKTTRQPGVSEVLNPALSFEEYSPFMKETSKPNTQEKLFKRHQALRKKSGLPNPEYYKELLATYDLPDQERLARQAEIKKKYRVAEGGMVPMKPRGEKPFKPSMDRPKGEWDPIHGKAPKKGTVKYYSWKQKVKQDKGISTNVDESLRPGEYHHFEKDPKTGKLVYKGIRFDRVGGGYTDKQGDEQERRDRDERAMRQFDRKLKESNFAKNIFFKVPEEKLKLAQEIKKSINFHQTKKSGIWKFSVMKNQNPSKINDIIEQLIKYFGKPINIDKVDSISETDAQNAIAPDPQKLIARVFIGDTYKDYDLTGMFKGDVKSQLTQASNFITDRLEASDVNFSNLELHHQGARLRTTNIGSVKEQGIGEGGFDIPEIPRAPQPRPKPTKITVDENNKAEDEAQEVAKTIEYIKKQGYGKLLGKISIKKILKLIDDEKNDWHKEELPEESGIEEKPMRRYNPEYDDESGMAHTNLVTIARAADDLLDTIDDNENLPEWVQEKIAKVEGMLVAVWDYLKSQEAQGIDPRIMETYQRLAEDWQKVNKRDKTSGMSRKAVKAYRRENPGSKLQTAVTTKPSKLKKGSKSAKRRKSFCARMKGMKKSRASAKTKRNPDSPINKALRRWNCESVEDMRNLIMIAEHRIAVLKEKKRLEENLRNWFKDKWVRFGPDGKIRGECGGRDGSEGKPKCLPAAKAHSLGKKGRASAAARKRREDPNPERSGSAINVATKKNVKEQNAINVPPGFQAVTQPDGSTRISKIGSMSRAEYEKNMADYKARNWTPEKIAQYQNKLASGGFTDADRMAAFKDQEKSFGRGDPALLDKDIQESSCPKCGGPAYNDKMLAEKKDACYHKVKSRYKVWPSAYASGALVKCRKKGAKNWGNKTESAEQLDEKCWDTHKQVGMKKKGSRMVPNCVPK